MKDKEKTKEQLQNELTELRRQITELQKSEMKHLQIEKALKKSQLSLVSIFENIPQAVVYLNENGNIKNISPRFTELFGYTLEEVKDKNINEGMIHPSGKIEEGKNLDKTALSEGYFNYESIRKKKDGTLFPVSISGSNIVIDGQLKGIIGTYFDITERKKMEKELRENQQTLLTLMNNLPGMSYRCCNDRDWTMEFVSEGCLDLTGYKPEEIIDNKVISFGQLIHKDDQDYIWDEVQASMKAKKRYKLNYRIKTAEGKEKWVWEQAQGVFTADGKLLHIEGFITDTTERIQIEESLRKSQQEFASVFNSSPEAALYQDEDGRIININHRFTELFGYTLEEVKGRYIDEGMIYPADKIEEGKILTQKAFGGISCSDYETTRKKKDGTLIPVIISTAPVIINKETQGTIALYRDITERKQAEQLQQVLYNISKAANSSISLRQLYKTIHQELGTIIDTTNFHISLLDKGKNRINFDYFISEKDDISTTLKYDNFGSLSAYVIKTGRPLLVNRKQIDKMIERGKLIPSHLGTLTDERLWLGVPLKIEDKAIGAMVVQNFTNPELYSEKDIKIMEFVSSQVATAIERKKAEDALRKSQQEFASIFRNNPEALVYVDEKGTILNINPRFTELFGYTLKEIKGRNIDDGTIHPTSKLKEGVRLTKKSLKGYLNFETIRRKKDGTLFPVSLSISNIVIDGRLKGGIGTYFDITERKKLEEELEKLAHYDTLTGCCSRGYGLNLLEQQIKMANRKKTFVTLFYLDIDRFKYINDTFGHEEGDKVLKKVVQLFKSTLREADIICRLGGDEFLLIFPENSLNDASLIRERLNKNLKKLNQRLAKPYEIGFSIGLSYYNPANPLSIEELIKIADENMYKEKKKKKEGE